MEVSWVKRLHGMRLVRWCDGAMAERHKLVTRMINEEEEEGEARAKPVSRGRNFGPTREGRKCRIIMKGVRRRGGLLKERSEQQVCNDVDVDDGHTV